MWSLLVASSRERVLASAGQTGSARILAGCLSTDFFKNAKLSLSIGNSYLAE
jgi:hypothetical protein